MASFNSNSSNQIARQVFEILLPNPRAKVLRVKANVGNIGNETEDQLEIDSKQYRQVYTLTKPPKPHVKGLHRKSMLQKWQTSWNNGDTGKKSLTSYIQLVFVALTGLERMLSSTLNMVLSLRTSKCSNS
ncbi:hypothetical protein AVEN_131131-1 [Araneus ventricosus]|uniref:Uncharacterized protein n=1 Tax=Araneus ventricosus TaxID=182803 RepID=A0A4Y2GIB1_ARAVE|nr:hypothetical protein AVEN_197222-1 [Araneus ventricosus]GBO40015.1 hypothetical protein AVEN_131131-1 [Araneus ventricosus]